MKNKIIYMILCVCLLAGCSYEKTSEIKKPDVDCTAKYPASKAISVELKGKHINTSENISCKNKIITIDNAGSYWVTGSSDSLMFNITADGEVDLYLDNVQMLSIDNSVIHSGKDTNLHVIAVPETKNTLQDNEEHKDEYNGVISAESDLTIEGSGSIEIFGNYKDGITASGVCKVYDTVLNMNTKENGIQAKELSFEKGKYTIISGETCVSTTNDTLSLISGEFDLTAGNDAVHSENSLICKKPKVIVKSSKEGLEGVSIDIFDGTYEINANDDGINSSQAKKDKKEENVIQGKVLNKPTSPDYENWTPEDGQFHEEVSKGCYIHIHGGDIQIVANGDGIDSNDNIIIDDGNLLVYGGVAGNDASLDFATTATINGGSALFYGMKGMVTPFTDGECNSALFILPEVLPQRALITILDSKNKEIYSLNLAGNADSLLLGNIDIGLYTVKVGQNEYQYKVEKGHRIYLKP